MFYGTKVIPDCSKINFSSTVGLKGLFAGTQITDA
jgi:hypothetical protein